MTLKEATVSFFFNFGKTNKQTKKQQQANKTKQKQKTNKQTKKERKETEKRLRIVTVPLGLSPGNS